MVYAEDLKSSVFIDVGVRVPLALQIVMKKNTTPRNAFAILAKKRKAGVVRSKKDKRQNGKNKQKEFLSENEE